MFEIDRIIAVGLAFSLCACGGSSVTTTTTAGGSATHGSSGAPRDATNFAVSGGNGGVIAPPSLAPPGAPLLSNAINLNAAQIDGLNSWRRTAASLFDALNTSPTAAPATAPTATAGYEGDFLAQIAAAERYLAGDLALTLDFASGTGTGTIDTLDTSGSAVVGRLMTLASQIDVTVDSLSGASLTGSLAGALEEAAVAGVPSQSYDVQATLEARVVDDRLTGGLRTAVAGVVTGTLTPQSGGALPLDGIVAAQETPGSRTP